MRRGCGNWSSDGANGGAGAGAGHGGSNIIGRDGCIVNSSGGGSGP